MRGSKRFWRLVHKERNGCWEWKGPIKQGQPVCPVKNLTVQRFALLDKRREAHRHDTIKMLCGNSLCVRPSHMNVTKAGPRVNFTYTYRPPPVGGPAHYRDAINDLVNDMEKFQ